MRNRPEHPSSWSPIARHRTGEAIQSCDQWSDDADAHRSIPNDLAVLVDALGNAVKVLTTIVACTGNQVLHDASGADGADGDSHTG